jgi:hypothetical protein
MLAVCLGCGGSSSETPPPLEPDPKRLLPPAEAPASEEPAPATPAAAPPAANGAAGVPSESVVEDGAEFGIESPAAAHPSAAGPTGTHQTWGGSSTSTPAARPKRPPKAP